MPEQLIIRFYSDFKLESDNMAEHIRITTGELAATISEYGEFRTKEVEFIGSADEPDCILQGMDSKIGLIFYLPICNTGKYVLHPGSDAKAFFEVGGRLQGEVVDGFVDVTVDRPDKVRITFDMSIEETPGGACIRTTGNASFEGRMPWQKKHRELLNLARTSPLWLEGPDILQPMPGEVSQGFRIVGGTTIADPSEYELEILIGSDVIHRYRGQSGRKFSYDVPANVIKMGQSFYFRLDYYISPFWSKWTYSGDLKIAAFPNPQILGPSDNDFVTTDTPEAHGIGYPGARVVVKDVGNTRVVGDAYVDEDQTWRATLDLPYFPFAMCAKQTLRQDSSEWSNIVHVNRSHPELKRPVISKPAEGARIKWDELEVSGGNCREGATVTLYKSGSGAVNHGSAKVREDGTWTIKPVQLYVGPYTLTVQQSLDGRVSEHAEDLKVTLTIW